MKAIVSYTETMVFVVETRDDLDNWDIQPDATAYFDANAEEVPKELVDELKDAWSAYVRAAGKLQAWRKAQ